MIPSLPDAVQLVKRLKAAGVEFGYLAWWKATGKPIPAGMDYTLLPLDKWDADLAPLWPILPESHPDAAVVDEAAARCRSDMHYRNRLADACDELLFVELTEEYGDDWGPLLEDGP